MKAIHFLSILLTLLSIGCSSDDSLEKEPEVAPPPVDVVVTPISLETYNSEQGVMMQSFYWDVEPRGQWWNIITDHLKDWRKSGVDRLWLPVATKGQSGGYSMGYDPSDYFDFGEFMQHGTVATRFGTREELETLIANAHANDMEVIADIVLNHNSGGGLEYNPYREKQTYTLFDETHGNASGMFNRDYESFHPNDHHDYDEGNLFYDEQDICHHQEYVQDWLWKNDNS